MKRKSQDYVWQSCLPREFKEKVKKEYARCVKIEVDDNPNLPAYAVAAAISRRALLESLFGEHNLTSDADGEEMLTCVKDQAVKLYNIANKAYAINGGKYYQGYMNAMIDLFGSKCLPDETCNVASKEPNPAEGYDVFNDPEPKCLHFKDGKCAHPAVAHLENGKLVKGADCDVSSCEDVEYEPKPAEPKEEADEHFDTIVKGGFRNERRLNIAAQITSSIYANDEIASRFDSIEALVRKALDIADVLIAECEKGGNHD